MNETSHITASLLHGEATFSVDIYAKEVLQVAG